MIKGFAIMAARGGGNGEIAEMRAWWGEWGAPPDGAGCLAGAGDPAGQVAAGRGYGGVHEGRPTRAGGGGAGGGRGWGGGGGDRGGGVAGGGGDGGWGGGAGGGGGGGGPGGGGRW